MVSKNQKTLNKKKSRKPKMSENLIKEEYTIEEMARIAKYSERSKENSPVKLKIFAADKKAGNSNVVSAEMVKNKGRELDNTKMFETFGTTDMELQHVLLNQAIETFSNSIPSEDEDADCIKLTRMANSIMAILAGIHPQDEIEGMLAVQMIAVHNMAMETMKRAMLPNQTSEGRESNVNSATKMLRTFVSQMEALQRHRTGGQQKMTVEHVNVTAGGQAIVGVVNQGGNNEKRE